MVIVSMEVKILEKIKNFAGAAAAPLMEIYPPRPLCTINRRCQQSLLT